MICYKSSKSINVRQVFHQRSTDFMLMATFKKFCKSDRPHRSMKTHYKYWLYRSLSDVLFLKENGYSEQQVDQFGLADLEGLRNAVVDEFMDSSVRFNTNLYNELSAALRVRLCDVLGFRALSQC